MSRQAAFLILLHVAACGPALPAQDSADNLAFFEKKIRPVLAEHCYQCHAANSKTIRAGLLLDTREGTRKGGDSGPAVVPGKPDESLLIEAMQYDGYEMPPSGKLPDAVVGDFRKWIREGAVDPRDGKAPGPQSMMDPEKGRQFWSFRPPQQPVVPSHESDWVRSDVDRLTLAAIKNAGLEPSPPASPRTLLRRIYFDLIGLPPSPPQIRSFLDDPSDAAFERVVDELLASRHFGERWGRHWLDVARYSDSTGGGRSALFQTSWRYRNYVIDALNQDLAFDEFIQEQIAGDLMASDDPQTRSRRLTATAFLAMGPTNYEQQDKKQLRMDVVDEQIDTIGRAFMGMTIGCARCHDHKFDPIPTRDYYALAGIFRSTRSLIHANVSTWVKQPLPLPPNSPGHAREAEIAKLRQQVSGLQTSIRQMQNEAPEFVIDNPESDRNGVWKVSTHTKGFVGRNYEYSADRSGSAVYRFIPRSTEPHVVEVSYTPGSNRSPNARYIVETNSERKLHVVDQRKANATGQGFVPLGTYQLQAGQVLTVTIENRRTRGVVIADAVRIVPVGSPKVQQRRVQLAKAREAFGSLQNKLAALMKDHPSQPVVMSVEEEKDPADYHVCIRGNIRKPGDSVPRGFLSVVSSKPPSIPSGSSGRLELAQWIASDRNPLTARVAVNRIWHHLFGAGLVRTVDNFGIPGERPSHPELLDHLAVRFTNNGWSVKSLIRDIVLSATYRQSSTRGPVARKKDPENRLLSHQNVRRVDAEALRDTVLVLSGQLDRTPIDNSVRPDTKTEYGYRFSSRRRSVYLPVFRNQLHDLLAHFDFPDPNLSTGRRSVSTLSTQALFLMNSPFVLEQSRHTAKQLLTSENTNAARLDYLYEQGLGRLPTDEERRLALSFLTGKENGWAAVCQAVIGCVDFRYVR